MTIYFIYTKIDGSVSVVSAAPKAHIENTLQKSLTDEEYVNLVYTQSIPSDALNVKQITENDIPKDRTFRDAWCDTTSSTSIDIDCDKAKNIVLANVRKQREDLFKPLDDKFMMAIEKGLDTSAISLEKQKLRDVTNPIKAIDATGKVNDHDILNQLITLSNIN